MGNTLVDRFKGLWAYSRRLIEHDTPDFLGLAGLIVVLLEVLQGVGLWKHNFFKNGTEEVILFLLGVYILGSASQIRLLKRTIEALTEKIEREASVSKIMLNIGVTSVWKTGNDSRSKWEITRSEAKTLSILTISAYTWTIGQRNMLVELLYAKGCRIQILLAEPESEFVKLREIREGIDRETAISDEIRNTVKEYKIITSNNRKKMNGSLEIRYCKGDIPNRIEIVNKKYILWTPFIIPARTNECPTFELTVGQDASAFHLLVNYFEKLWDESSQNVVLKLPSNV